MKTLLLTTFFTPLFLFAQSEEFPDKSQSDEQGIIPIFEVPEILQDIPQANLVEEIPEEFTYDSSISCIPNKTIIEIDEEVTWTYEAAQTTTVIWQGETLTGATESQITTTYPKTGLKSASIITQTPLGEPQEIICGNVNVILPPLSISCKPTEKFIKPGQCTTWTASVETSALSYTLKWKGHPQIEAQNTSKFKTCYTDEGYYLADLNVIADNQNRTIYCGSIFVDDSSTESVSLANQATNGFISNGDLIEGYCHANTTEAHIGQKITWTAVLNQNTPNSAISWYGSKNLIGKTGQTQDVIYTHPQEAEASFTVRSDSGETYRFPCSHQVLITEQTESSAPPFFTILLEIIRKILILGILIYWSLVLFHTIKKRK